MGVEEVAAYRCTICQTLYLGEKVAEKCSKRCLNRLKREKQAQRIREQKQRLADSVRLEARNYDEIWELLIRYSKEHLGLTLRLDQVPNNFSDKVSNTHRCPIGGITNWGCRPGKPRGYPGWEGRFEGRVSGKRGVDLHALFQGSFVGDCDLPFSFRGFHTGTGCPGDKFSISGYIFLSDFPKVEEWLKSIKVAERLSGKTLCKSPH